MSLTEIALDRLLIDDALNPRDHLDAKHVQEFVEMAGDWPPILVRPIEDGWYTHQLVDGFHRASAAEKLELGKLAARSEAMDDATAIARAIRENLHGLPLTTEQRMAACVELHEMGWKQEKIAEQTGITQPMVGRYLAAHQVHQKLVVPTTLPIDQAARLGKLGDSPQLPIIAQAASEHKLSPTIVSALAEAAIAAPEHTPRIVERAVQERLAPDAIRMAGAVLGNSETPADLKAHVLESETLIHDAEGNYPTSEISRAQKLGEKQSQAAMSYPFSAALVKLAECVQVSDESIHAWLDTTPLTLRDTPKLQLRMVADWLAHVQEIIEDNKRSGFHAVK